MSPLSARYTEAWLDGADGHHFYTRTYVTESTPKAVLLFVHGFADHITRYEDIHSGFAQRGIAVFAYDMRGFGRTALDGKHRSKGEAYGKTNRAVELSDLEWWVQHVRRTFQDVPIFLMGYSAGGGLVLAFATRSGAPPKRETLDAVSGIIAQAPLIALAHPPPPILRFIANVLGRIAPTMSIPAPVPEKHFSRDPAVVEAISKDPLRRPQGTIGGLRDMINQGAEILAEDYKRWPKELPLLMTWGLADKVNSPEAGVAFLDKIDIKDKKVVEYKDAYHDLLHEVGDVPTEVVELYITWIESHLGAIPTH